VLDALGFDGRLARAALAISGEGKLDEQTLTGKAIAEVARRCRAAGRPLHVVVGTSALDRDAIGKLGLAGVREATTLAELETAGRALAADLEEGA
jgi:glycerate kinase